MPVLFLLYFLLVNVALFWVPGRFLVRIWKVALPDGGPLLEWAVGMAVVCYTSLLVTGLGGLVWPLQLTGWMVVGISVAICLCSALWLRHRDGIAIPFRMQFPRFRPVATQVWIHGLLLVAVFFIYLLIYDSTLFDQERCIARACLLPVKMYLGPVFPLGFDGCTECFSGRNGFFLWNGGQRMGPSVFIAPFVSLFGFPGFRLLHAVCGLLIAGCGYQLGSHLFKNHWQGIALALLLSLNRTVLAIPLVDENIICLALGLLLFVSLSFQVPSVWLSGLFLGLFLGIRHIGVLSLPAVFLAIWWATGKGRRVRSLFIAAGATALFSIPWLFIHLRALIQGEPLYESFLSFPPVAHSFLGLEFTMRGLLNWPFAQSLVRSPFNGFPTLLSVPLSLISTFGILALAFVPLGLLSLFRTRRHLLYWSAAWILPQIALLSVMANWVEPNKGTVFLSFVQPIPLVILAGVVELRRRWRNHDRIFPVLITCLTSAAVLCILVVAGRMDLLPVDGRSYESRVHYIAEVYPVTPPLVRDTELGYAQLEQSRLSSLRFTPFSFLPGSAEESLFPQTAFPQFWRDLSTSQPKDYCPRGKDFWRALPGIMRKDDGRTVALDEMMHRPMSKLASGSEDCSIVLPDSTQWLELTLDLSQPPPAPASELLSFRLPDEKSPVEVVSNTHVAARQFVPWMTGDRLHLALFPSAPDMFWLFIWYGDYRFDHLNEQSAIVPSSLTSDFHWQVPVPAGVRLRIVDVSSAAPNRFHVWEAVTAVGATASGPMASSY
jgi:hypothetical protein